MNLKTKLSQINNSPEFWTLAHLAALTYVISVASFTLLFLIAPLLIQLENYFLLGVGAVSYNIISMFVMCHQLPERSLFLFGVQYPICARCIGIYLGSSVGGLLAFFYGRPKFMSKKMLLTVFIISFMPMAIDGVTQTLLYQRESSNMLRFATGLLFGFGVLYTVTSIIFKKSGTLVESKKDINKIALGINLFMIMLILLSAVYVGSKYIPKESALKIALEQVGSVPTEELIYYFPPNAVKNIKNDPYLGSYNDVLLKDLSKINFKEHSHGVWAVLLLGEPPQAEGKIVFLSETRGTYVYIDAWTGKLIKSLEYS